jgi:ribosome-binding ATPase
MLVGICGKPSTGKSTFLKAATLSDVEVGSFPFTTISPNRATGYVKIDCVDKEFNKQCDPRLGYCVNHKRFIPVEILDVAGLVPGAHEGKGLGNQFLDDLRQAHVLIHVVDISGSLNEKGEDVERNSYDPANDIKFLEHELDMWYFQILKKGWDKFARQMNQEKGDVSKALAKQLSGLGVEENHVKVSIKSLDPDPLKWDQDTLKFLATELRKLTKPMIIACNKIDVPGGDDNYNKLKEQFPDHLFVPCSAESELGLREAAKHELIDYIPGEDSFKIKDESKLSDKQKVALQFVNSNILEKYSSTGIQDTLDKAVFELLKYKAIFPGGVNNLVDSDGNVLPDCFLLKEEATALDFAFHLHTDFGKGFIKAINVKTKLPIGKDHVLAHRDVVEIMSK